METELTIDEQLRILDRERVRILTGSAMRTGATAPELSAAGARVKAILADMQALREQQAADRQAAESLSHRRAVARARRQER